MEMSSKLVCFFTWLKAGPVIWSQDVSWSAATSERPLSVDTPLLTHAVVDSTLVKVFKEKIKMIAAGSLIVLMGQCWHTIACGVVRRQDIASVTGTLERAGSVDARCFTSSIVC